jgi:hypothetical protein
LHLNRELLLGRLGPRGVRLTDNASATPTCSFVLEVDKIGRDGKVYTSFHSVEITGKHAEPCAEQRLPGDEVLVGCST